MVAIAAPALIGLAIEPVASLVDTAFVGRCCGAVELSGVGIGISVFNLVAKAFSFLSPATTSLVAAVASDTDPGSFNEPMVRATSASLSVAAAVGLAVTAVLTLGSNTILKRLLRVSPTDPLRPSACAYLSFRALAAPAVLGMLCMQGAFRGARDTKTPLAALTVTTLSNVVLDAVCIPSRFLGWGAAGAAAATTVAQYAGTGVLLRSLLRRCRFARGTGASSSFFGLFGLPTPRRSDCATLLSAGSVLTLRTLAVVSAFSLSSIAASHLGPNPGAAHQVCLQVWLASSLLADAVAIAAQALLASYTAAGEVEAAKAVVRLTISAGAAVGVATAALLLPFGPAIVSAFTSDPAVRALAVSAWPAVALSQPLSTLAFAYDGLLFGTNDFRFCALAMIFSAVPAMATIWALAPCAGLLGIWAGLAMLMGLRATLAAARIFSGTGPWGALK
jgi:putative MATE family efflux protein